jgi:hypothetical protein
VAKKKTKRPAAARVAAKKKLASKTRLASRRRKTAVRRSKSAAKRPAAARGRSRPATKKKAAKKSSSPKGTARKAKRIEPVRRRKGAAGFDVEAPLDRRGLGAEAGGQSGDTEGLSRAELADSESVEELLEEGQAFEAGIVSGVENAPDADEGEIRTREVPEDDVPQEYLDED